MAKYAERYPDRFHDVAIAEQHAVTLDRPGVPYRKAIGQKPVDILV